LEKVPNGNTAISRVNRSKEQAKFSYDKMSRWYDALAGSSEKSFVDVGLDKLCTQEGEIVLEIGFGTGHGILSLARSVGDSGKVYGIDISEGMLNVAQARVRGARLSNRVDLKCGDAANLPFESNSFDALFASFTLELFDTPEIPIVLHECHRVLRSGGRVCVVAMSKKGTASLVMRAYQWLHQNFPKYVDCRPIFVQQALEETRFEAVDVTQMSMWGLPVEIVVAKKP
jgi:ubiquinone/menaquinone biosynthesis C-methylase UbiE